MNIERPCPKALEAHFFDLVETPSDINEHLWTLRSLAEECEHVTEFGMRTGLSTAALLAGQPKKLVTWDINIASVISTRTAELANLASGGRTDFEPRVGNTLEISPIEPTDMLFIDSLHTATHLLAELKRHADPARMHVKKYLVFHDTILFGDVGEDGQSPGLRGAIRFFQSKWALPQWELLHDFKNNNGLVVLRAAT